MKQSLRRRKSWVASVTLCIFLAVIHIQSVFSGSVTTNIDNYLQSETQAGRFSGAVLVAKDDKIIFSKGYGWADREQMLPNTPQTRFQIGSLTKQFTSAAVMLLVERGKLKTTSKISEILPGYPDGDAVTIENLLTHTSGLHEYLRQPEVLSIVYTPQTPSQLMNLYHGQPLDFKPGSRWSYSNTGYLLLGSIVEKLSGTDYGTFLRDEIFRPSNMPNASYDSTGKELQNDAKGYEGLTLATSERSVYIHPSVAYAAGGVRASVEDFYKWDMALSAGTVLQPQSVAQMNKSFKGGYGFGWFVTKYKGHSCVWHNGTIPGFQSFVVRFPQDKSMVVVLSNYYNSNPTNIGWKLSEFLLADN